MAVVYGARSRAPVSVFAGLSTHTQLPPFRLTAGWRWPYREHSAMYTEENKFTVGKTTFYQGENQTHPLFRIEAGIPCQSAREQASELMGYARDMTLDGLMEDKPQLIWASHYLCALAKALMDDAELGMMK